MDVGVSASRSSVVNLIIAACLVAVSCSDHESPTSPMSSSPSASKATISGTLLVSGDGPAGAAGQPLASAAVRVVSTGQTAQTDAAGNFTLAGVTPGAVALEIRGAGIQASATVNASAAMVTKVTVTVSRGRSTVSLGPRSDGIEGIVDSISAPNFVLRNSRGKVMIRTDASTRFRMEDTTIGFGDLKVGQRVEAEGTPQPDGSLLAARVKVEDAEREDATKTPTVTGTPPTATPTRTPRPDDDDRTKTPTVTGTPPTATPTRTPRREDEDLEGTVGTVGASSFVLMARSGPVTIQTDASTRFRRDGDTASFADITTGERVEVKGSFQADGSVLATRVDIKGD